MQQHCHRRYNPLSDSWVLVSPHRTRRPWQGRTEQGDSSQDNDSPTTASPLSPGATRPNGKINPEYESTYIFPNDFPAMTEDAPEPPFKSVAQSDAVEAALFQSAGAHGRCDVMCFHPRPDVTLPLLTVTEIGEVINTWMRRFIELAPDYDWIQIFENKGAIMGCSNPHPHCQIWSSKFLPNEAATKDRTQREYFNNHKTPMLMDYVRLELEKKERIVCENSEWVALVPYWACWPYETILLPKSHTLRLMDLTQQQVNALSEVMKRLLTRYDNLFHTSCPYSMGWHGAPTGTHLRSGTSSDHWQLHAIYYPPLLRSASIKKFMVGYEMLAMPQRDITPEQAALTLRDLSDEHYKQRDKAKKD